MAELTLYFIRHGQTANNVSGRMQGQLDALLSEEGRAQLHDLKARYVYPPVDRLYSSPAIRARETAAILYPEMEPVLLPGLWELSFGAWEGRTMEEISQTPYFQGWLDQPWDFAFAGGETLLEGSLRIRGAITHIVHDAAQEGLRQVAVVAHGEIFNLLFRSCLVSDLPAEDLLLCPNGMGLVATADTKTWFRRQKLPFRSFFPEGAPRPQAADSPYFKVGGKK